MVYKKYRLTKPWNELPDEERWALRRKHETENPTFEELVDEWIENTKLMIGEEVVENFPPSPPWKQSGPPWEHELYLDEKICRIYARGIGDDNPLFTDPEYGKNTRYGCQIAPSPILAIYNYPGIHGFGTGGGARIPYPIAEFISGCAWEFYDVVRVGQWFRREQKQAEFFEKKGSKGRLFFLMSHNFVWNTHGDLLGKSYGTLIKIPMKTRHDVERIGEQILYDRQPVKYSDDEIQKILDCLEDEVQLRRGAEPRYWEDVEVGDQLPPIVCPPWNTQDHGQAWRVTSGSYSDTFEDVYKVAKAGGRTTINPITRWPYVFSAEHDDAVICKYRGMALPFDLGVQRFQIPGRLLYNWMGDDGFLRRMYTALRKTNYWGDVTWFRGEVVNKFTRTEKGEAGPGGVPGEETYCAVGIRIDSENQLGENSTPGTATVYLPSKEFGSVKLPIPHPPRPPYVPFLTHRRDWY